MTRRARLLIAIAAAAALVFAQLAISAYACPMAEAAPAMAQGECDEAVMVDMSLCQSHCDYGNASVDAAKPVHAVPVAITSSLRIELPDVAIASMAAPSPHVAPGPSPPPPLSRHTVLRL